jgi:hypothetical protein
MSYYEPMSGGRNQYANVDNDSGTQNGDTHATGYKDIKTAMEGCTWGDVLWVHCGLTFQGTDIPAYTASGGNMYVRNVNLNITTAGNSGFTSGFAVIGYANGTTLESVSGKDRPLFQHRVTNSSGWFQPTGSDIMNMRMTGWHYNNATNGSGVFAHVTGSATNCQFISEDEWSNELTRVGARGMAVTASGNARFENCEFIERLSASNFVTRSAGFEGPWNFSEARLYRCVFKIEGDGPWLAFNKRRVQHGIPPCFIECIFIGNGAQVGVNSLAGQDGGEIYGVGINAAQSARFQRCIFYNMNTGFRHYTPNHASTPGTLALWDNSNGGGEHLTECIFHSCETGILTSEYDDPPSWTDAAGTFSIKGLNVNESCAFYNMTSAQFSGDFTTRNPITLSADPFIDAANGDFRLNNTPGGGAVLKAKGFDASDENYSSLGFQRKHFPYELDNTPIKETTRTI